MMWRRRHASSSVASESVSRIAQQTMSCSSLDGKKEMAELVFWLLRFLVNEQLDAVVEVGNMQIDRAQ